MGHRRRLPDGLKGQIYRFKAWPSDIELKAMVRGARRRFGGRILVEVSRIRLADGSEVDADVSQGGPGRLRRGAARATSRTRAEVDEVEWVALETIRCDGRTLYDIGDSIPGQFVELRRDRRGAAMVKGQEFSIKKRVVDLEGAGQKSMLTYVKTLPKDLVALESGETRQAPAPKRCQWMLQRLSKHWRRGQMGQAASHRCCKTRRCRPGRGGFTRTW